MGKGVGTCVMVSSVGVEERGSIITSGAVPITAPLRQGLTDGGMM